MPGRDRRDENERRFFEEYTLGLVVMEEILGVAKAVGKSQVTPSELSEATGVELQKTRRAMTSPEEMTLKTAAMLAFQLGRRIEIKLVPLPDVPISRSGLRGEEKP